MGPDPVRMCTIPKPQVKALVNYLEKQLLPCTKLKKVKMLLTQQAHGLCKESDLWLKASVQHTCNPSPPQNKTKQNPMCYILSLTTGDYFTWKPSLDNWALPTADMGLNQGIALSKGVVTNDSFPSGWSCSSHVHIPSPCALFLGF